MPCKVSQFFYSPHALAAFCAIALRRLILSLALAPTAAAGNVGSYAALTTPAYFFGSSPELILTGNQNVIITADITVTQDDVRLHTHSAECPYLFRPRRCPFY
jgi:hypothetical protein